MKTATEIEIKKVRKRLQQYPITEEEKMLLRKNLKALKKIAKAQKETA